MKPGILPVIWAGLWLGLFRLSGQLPPNSSLDASWEWVVEHATSEGWQFGRQIVFPFGPLGFLYADHGSGRLFAARYLFAALFAGLLVAASWCMACRMPRWAGAAFLAWLGVFSRFEEQVLCLFACAAWLAMSTRGRFSRWDLLICVAGAILSCVKINFLVMAGMASGACLFVCALRRERVRACLFPTGLVAGIFVVWVACGQSPANLFRFLTYNAELTGGYSHAMSVPVKGQQLIVAMLSLCAFAMMLGLSSWRNRLDFECRIFFLLVLALTFTAWKHAVVRGGTHFSFLYFWLPLAACFVLVRGWGCGTPVHHGVWQGTLLAMVMSLSFDGAGLISEVGVPDMKSLMERLSRNMRHAALIFPGRTRSSPADAGEGDPRYNRSLHKLRDTIGEEPVDLFHFQQGLAALSGLHPRFRPMIQSYTAYTRGLMELDWEFYRDGTSPRMLVFNLEAIDVQYPAAAPSRLLPAWVAGYDIADRESGFLLLKRSMNPRQVLIEPARTVQVSFGQAVEVPESRDGAVWCEIEMDPTLRGKMRAFAFKGTSPIIQIPAGSRKGRRHRLPVEFARAGFLLSPYMKNNEDMEDLVEGRPGQPVSTFMLTEPAGATGLYKNGITVRLSRLRWVAGGK
jgi:hypothetical protein